MNLDKSNLPREVRDRLAALDPAADLSELVLATRGKVAERRREAPFELRSNDDGTIGLSGYAATFDTPYDVAGGPERGGWSESFAPGAFTKTLRDQSPVRFLINHDGLPLANTKSGTMTLTQDHLGLRVDVPSLDPTNPTVQELVSALRRGDVDQMSHAFIAHRDEWNKDYTERRVTEAQEFDVSAVTYPANDATILALRSTEPTQPAVSTRSLRLALAEIATELSA